MYLLAYDLLSRMLSLRIFISTSRLTRCSCFHRIVGITCLLASLGSYRSFTFYILLYHFFYYTEYSNHLRVYTLKDPGCLFP